MKSCTVLMTIIETYLDRRPAILKPEYAYYQGGTPLAVPENGQHVEKIINIVWTYFCIGNFANGLFHLEFSLVRLPGRIVLKIIVHLCKIKIEYNRIEIKYINIILL